MQPTMFDEGNLLLFTPFYFSDGSSKPKFFVVLNKDENEVLLASLPTSKDHVPGDLDIHGGCYELPERNVNVYVFMKDVNVATNPNTGLPFAFRMNTFIYGADLRKFPAAAFEEQVNNGETVIELKGKINTDIYDDLKRCLKNSVSVKNKYKKLL